MIDRHPVEIQEIQEEILTNLPELGTNDVQIGGLNTTDPRFAIYKGYNGCLSSTLSELLFAFRKNRFSDIFIEVNNHSMKPLEEYMLFTKSVAEKVLVTNPHGVRSAQCADHFDIIHKLSSGPTLNISQGIDKTWVEDPPERVPYKSLYSEVSREEEGTGRMVVITLSVLFVIVIIACVYEVYRSDRSFRKRKEQETDASIKRSKEHALKMQEPTKNASLKSIKLEEAPNGKVKSNGATQNGGNNVQYIPLTDLNSTPERKVPVNAERRISFRGRKHVHISSIQR